MNRPFPWQLELWQRVFRARNAGRMPHALLLTGSDGNGVADFSRCLAEAMLCRSPAPGGYACGGCQSCLLISAESHPDLHCLTPSEEGKSIKIDQVRELTEFFTLKSQYGAYKIARVVNAEAMTRNAADSLLKTLEEPPAAALLILASSRPGDLPITIRSRCHTLRFSRRTDPSKLKWLRTQLRDKHSAEHLLSIAGFAPLYALQLQDSSDLDVRLQLLLDLEAMLAQQVHPLDVAARWNKMDWNTVLRWLGGLIEDLIRYRLWDSAPTAVNSDFAERLRSLSLQCELRHLYRAWDRLNAYRSWLQAVSGLATLNLLEEFTMNWVNPYCVQPD